MQNELAEECTRELDYRALVETLLLLEDEEVCLMILGLQLNPGGKGPRAAVRGVLRKTGHPGDSFAMGDGGRLVLYEPDFVSASLWTYDGNDYFELTIRFGDVSFLVGDKTYGMEMPPRRA